METTIENYFDIEVEIYTDELYQADELDPDAPNKKYIWSQPPGMLARPVTHDEVVELINQAIPPQPDIEIPWLSNCDWTGNEVNTVSWAARAETEPITLRYRGTTYEITPDNTTNEFIYWNPNYPEQFLSSNNAATALAFGNWLMCTNKAGVPYPAVPMQLLHAAVLQAGTITAAYGQIADLTVGTLKIQYEAVTILTVVQDDSWWYLDPSPLSQAGYGLYRVAVWTPEFTSSGFPCQIIFDTSANGENLTFVTKSMHAIFRTVDTYSELSISTITLSGSNPVKITTAVAHGLNTDDFVWFWDIIGTIELNDAICKVTVVNSTEFTLQLTRSDWFTAYTSGGKVKHVNLWGLRYGFLYHGHDTGVHISLFDDFLEADKTYRYIGAVRNRNASEYAYINEGSTIMALEIKR